MKVEYKGQVWDRAGNVPRGSIVTNEHGGNPWILGEIYHNKDHGTDYVRAIRLNDGCTDGFDVDMDVIVLDAKVVIG